MQILRGSTLGTLVGALPGAGADIAAWMSYAMSKKFSKEPEKFGTGHVEGIVESGAANNSALAGAWIPALVFGIPGDSITAIVIGVLYMKNMNPGPTLFTTNPQNIYAVFLLFIIANLIMIPLGWLCIKVAKRILRVPRNVLMPIILLFCIVGAFAINNTAVRRRRHADRRRRRLRARGERLPDRAGDPRRRAGRHARGELHHVDDQGRRQPAGVLQPADRRRARRADARDLVLAAAAAPAPQHARGRVAAAPLRHEPSRFPPHAHNRCMQAHAVDSRYAWGRLVVALALMTVGSSAMYVVAVVLPSVQAEFGVARADASLPYTLLMIGFGIGGVFMGRLADRTASSSRS